VRGAKQLYAANVDAATAFHRWLEPRRELLAAIALRGTYLDEQDVARLLTLSLPGIDEVIGLIEIRRMSRLHPAASPEGFGEAGSDGWFDTVIVDTAPTGHTLRLLAAPALLGRVAGVLDSLQSHHRAVVSALRGSYRRDGADALIAELEADGESLSAMLRDPASSEISWVTLPEPMALEETSDALASLAAAGIHARRLIVNRITPFPRPDSPVSPKRRRREGGPSSLGHCEWCDARRRFEARALAPVARRFDDLEVLALPELPAEPRGVVALRGASSQLQPWVAPPALPPIAHRVRALSVPPKGGSYKRTRRSTSAPSHDPVVSVFRRKETQGPVVSAFRRKETRPADLLEGSVRWLLFGGKGGVGKSTCAAATALDLAGRNPDTRVLLISMDPAHSLGDVFGATLGDRPGAVPGGPANLQVREIDTAAEMRQFRETYVAAVDDAFARIARSAGGDQAAFRELIDLAPPGIDEVIAVADVAEALTESKGRYGVIVTDTAPTGHALRLLQTPAVLRDWTQALMAILLKYREIVGAGTLASLLVQLSKRLRGLQEILRDPVQTRFVVVTRAAALPAAESEGLIASLGSLGIAVQAVIVNALGAGSCARCRASSRAQMEEVERLRRAPGAGRGYAIIEAPAEVPPPHGAAALAAWGLGWRRIT
jgi:arsenite/tail-anchored protein-transporting ATPase